MSPRPASKNERLAGCEYGKRLRHLRATERLKTELIAGAVVATGEREIVCIASQVAEQDVGRDEFVAT